MVSFIILNYNGAHLTKECVVSIERHIKITPYEIIIVDNGSKDDDYEKLRYLKHTVYRSKINLGFGGGNMLGANFAEGNFLCFINSDVIFVEDCVSPLCEYLESHRDIGCVTPVQYNKNGGEARSFKHPFGIRHELFGDKVFEMLFPKLFPNRNKVSKTIIVSEINGCFMLFRADDFWKIKGFDTNIFLYCEEYDISRKLRLLGMGCAVYSNAKFIHLNGASTHRNKEIKKELCISKIYTYSKYHHPFMSGIYRIVILLKMLVKPHRWYMIPSIIDGEVLSHSMKNRIVH
jgi:GT2 family glycosyltransferase